MLDCLAPQMALYGGEVEHIILSDGGEMTIGQKMNRLYAMATGKYVAALNDDDLVPSNYLDLILDAAKSDADVLFFPFWSGYVNGMQGPENYMHRTTINRMENVIPAKTELVRKYTIWDESRAMSYKQDSTMAELVMKNAESIHQSDQIIYYHLRQSSDTLNHIRSRM
jgi:Glycosyl transferase family 2.